MFKFFCLFTLFLLLLYISALCWFNQSRTSAWSFAQQTSVICCQLFAWRSRSRWWLAASQRSTGLNWRARFWRHFGPHFWTRRARITSQTCRLVCHWFQGFVSNVLNVFWVSLSLITSFAQLEGANFSTWSLRREHQRPCHLHLVWRSPRWPRQRRRTTRQMRTMQRRRRRMASRRMKRRKVVDLPMLQAMMMPRQSLWISSLPALQPSDPIALSLAWIVVRLFDPQRCQCLSVQCVSQHIHQLKLMKKTVRSWRDCTADWWRLLFEI